MNQLLAIIDATAKEQFDLMTLHRMPGALPFAGKYRLIDFALSNMKHAAIKNVAIFPYGNYRSLQDHIGRGKRWDLDRRRDGLFILPPKNMVFASQEMISFQRMHEHIEFFQRSSQPYVIITPANIVWNIDFNKVLEVHLETGVDITEIMSEKVRLKTFILSKALLLEYILKYDTLPYKNLHEVLTQSPTISVGTYKHREYTRYINDTFNYLKGNLDMLRFNIGETIFKKDAPILSKEKTAPPTYYGGSAKVVNSMIASGAMIFGTVKHSVIGRDVVVKKDAIVSNSVVMSNAVIEENAQVNYGILDKATIVKKDAIIEGSLRDPFVTEKSQIVKEQVKIHVLHVASEAYPFVKIGGLADVLGGLTENLVHHDVAVSVVLPLYKVIKEKYEAVLKLAFSKVIAFDDERYKVNVFTTSHKKVTYYFIENFKFFERDMVYGYDDDCTRFAFYSHVVVDILNSFGDVDLVHVHDWHTALIPFILKHRLTDPPKTLLTLHNISYQGICSVDVMAKLGIDPSEFNAPMVNFLETGIQTTTKLSTVSPTYRDQLRYDYFGGALTKSLMKRERDFYGILNGISSQYDPSEDTVIASKYDQDNLPPKTDNKLFLQKTMHLDMGLNYFVMGMISRLVEHKGFDILIPAVEQFMAANEKVQFVVLGQGEDGIIKRLKALKERFPKRVVLNIGYDAAVPNYIYAGADVFLMPSRVEPCGLSQMIAMRYGTLPIVHSTGGLADTIQGFDGLTSQGNGFSFYHYDTESLDGALKEAFKVFNQDKTAWKKVMRRAMESDFSLTRQATKMIELYHLIIEN